MATPQYRMFDLMSAVDHDRTGGDIKTHWRGAGHSTPVQTSIIGRGYRRQAVRLICLRRRVPRQIKRLGLGRHLRLARLRIHSASNLDRGFLTCSQIIDVSEGSKPRHRVVSFDHAVGEV
jgi:hypothetical protein